MDTTKEINDAKTRLDALEAQLRDLGPKIEAFDRLTKDLPHIAGAPVSNTPTANGYAPFYINGQRVNLLTGS